MSGMTLTEFLLARIAEDEADPWRGAELMGADRVVGLDEREALAKEEGEWEARVQRECKAKRRIIELHPQTVSMVPTINGTVPLAWCDGCDRPANPPCEELLILATIYADHPDYREGWML